MIKVSGILASYHGLVTTHPDHYDCVLEVSWPNFRDLDWRGALKVKPAQLFELRGVRFAVHFKTEEGLGDEGDEVEWLTTFIATEGVAITPHRRR